MGSIHITTGDGKSTEYDEDQVRAMLQQGNLRDDALYWKEGMSDWQSIQGLFPELATARRGVSAASREATVSEYNFAKNPFGLTRVLKVMLWVQLGVVVLSILSDFGQMSLVANGAVTVEAAEANDFRQSMVGILYLGVFVVTGVVFLQWVYRANLNCQGFGAADMEYTPGWSVGYYFIPILNLVRPYQSMKEIWNVSSDPKNWQSQPGSSILGWWWGLWIVSHILGNMSFRMDMNVDSPSSLEAATMVSIVSSSVEVLLILVAMVMVSSIIAKQSKLTKTKS